MKSDLWIWSGIIVMALTTYLIRLLPMILFRKPIKNQFLQSVLYYVPYAVLTALTIPAVFTGSVPFSAAMGAFIFAALAAYCNWGLLPVAIVAAASAYLLELIL